VRPVLLRSVNFFAVYKVIRVVLWHHVLWQNPIVLSLVILIVVFVETHCHWRRHVLRSSHATHASHVVLVVVHLEYLLLLSSQILVHLWSSTAILAILSSVHYSEAHGTWHKNVVLSILPTTWCFNLRLIHEIIGMLNMMRRLALRAWLIQSLQVLVMCWWSILVCVVGDISAILYYILIRSKRSFLVMTIKLLNIKTSTSLMRSKGLTGF